MEILQTGLIKNSAFLAQKTVGGVDITTLNTLFIIGIAVVVLILVILVTNLFKNVQQITGTSANKAKNNENLVDNIIAQIVEKEEIALTDDFELVAVITAAIYASMGDAVPADGLIVRSIRKVNSKS